MKQKPFNILLLAIGLSSIVGLVVAYFLTNNMIFNHLAGTVFGLVIIMSNFSDIKKDHKISWSSTLYIGIGIWFILKSWFPIFE